MPNNDGYNILGIVKMLIAVIAVVLVATIFVLDMSKCSIVMDKTSQSGILVSEYCPKMEHCAEGAHVMCMYYNPNKIYGARCNNVQNVSMTQELANQLLAVSNGIRSKIALGKERGKGGNYLPRGYGVYRLEWDTELATFAQVLANQCVLRHDLCRATKKFADPGQTAGLVRFTYPDWFPVSKNGHFKTPGLDDEKLLYSTTQTLKSWYGQKESVNADMILRYPDWIQHPDDQGGRLYLEMIYGPATHMGCGVTAYTEYAYQDNNAALNYNSVQVVCNYSARPRKGGPVYNTDPPDGMELSPRCGCPMDAVEDMECLCRHASRVTSTVTPPKYLRTCEKGVNCDPTVVLLPIFTVEDAPPQKLAAKQRFSNITLPGDRSLDVFNVFETPENKLFPSQTNVHNSQDPVLEPKRTSFGVKKFVTNVKNRYFSANPRFSKQQYHDERNAKRDYGHEKKNGLSRNPLRKSLFARTSLFELPQSKKYKNNDPISPTTKGKDGFLRKKTYIRDVKPRKDFSSVQRLVKSYMNGKRGRKVYSSDVFVEKNALFNALNHPDKRESHNNLETEYDINKAKNRRNGDTFSKKKFRFEDFNITSGETYRNVDMQTSNDENDKKLMVLLNNLEQEVKHIELNPNEKEIFDEKIRKIYDKVVRKSVDPPKIYYDEGIKRNIHSDKEDHTSDGYTSESERNNNKKNSDDNNFYDTERKALEINQNLYGKYSDVEIRRRPVHNDIRTQNTLFNNDKVSKDIYQKPKSIGDVVNSWKIKDNQENSDKEYTFSDTDKISDDSIKGIRNTHYRDSENHVETLFRKLNTHKQTKEDRMSDTDMEADRHERRRQHSIDDDVLSVDRRKFYQEKLENIEKKLRNTRSYKRRSNLENDRQLRPVRPNKDLQIRPSKTKTQIDPFYVPDRARFLHGF